MHEVGVDILVIGRIAVQILMRVYLKDLKARAVITTSKPRYSSGDM